MKENFVEVTVKTDAEASELLVLLEDTDFLGSWEEKGCLHIYWPEAHWHDGIPEDIKRALSILDREETVDLHVRTVEDRDWNQVWAASLEPILLGKRIRIRQSWNPEDPSFKGIELVIDPKRAFGTGYHATTRMVLEWLEDNVRGGEHILDIGTGSGILSMAAIRLGAEASLALDIDATAIECAVEYASSNGFGDEIEFRVASFETLESAGYDLILANIDGRTLPKLCPHMPRLMKSGGRACFSGLQYQDYREISNALADAGCTVAAHRQRGEWLALEIIAPLNVQS